MAEQGAQFKFDKNNPEHVKALTKGDVEVFPGGLMAFRTPSKNSESKPADKAVASKKRAGESTYERSSTPKKRSRNLDKVTALEDAAKKRGDIRR